jgi:SNF2 family DNA or RNA helicase
MDIKDHKYKLDKDGYVVVRFVDKYGKTLPYLSTKNDKKEEIYHNYKSVLWNIESGITDSNLIELVDSQLLTKKNILNFNLTDILRGSYYNEYLKKCNLVFLEFRPLPIKTHILNNIDEKIKINLYPHQDKAIAFMRSRESIDPRLIYGIRGGIIKMEMGLGKTLCSITYSLISSREKCKEKHGENGFPTLIIASKTVMMEWKSEGFEKFFGNNVKVLYLHKDYINSDINTITRQQVVKYDFVITTYDVCSTVCHKYNYYEECVEMGDEHSLMNGKIVSIHCRTREQSDKPNVVGPSIIYTTPWERCFCDESQKFCNPDTKMYKYMMSVYGKYKWCITGTPVKNYQTDIWAQLRFCGYNGITRKIDWKRRGHHVMKSHNLITCIINMNYEDANIKIPEKINYKIFVSLKNEERECYDIVSKVAKDVYSKMVAGKCKYSSVLEVVVRLRQCSIAPYLITSNSKRQKCKLDEINTDKESINMLKSIYEGPLSDWIHDKTGSAGIYSKKMTQIVSTVDSIPSENKVLIFSMFTSVLDLLSDALTKILPTFKFVQIDGDTKGKDRLEYLKSFRKNKNTRGLLMTYNVGAEGLNLIEANHVICIEPWWTNSVHNQAISRCHRIGQTKIVEVHNIYVKDSIEERIIEICKKKDTMVDSILEGTDEKILQDSCLNKTTIGKILGL